MNFDLKKLKNISPGDRLTAIYDRLEQAGITRWPVEATALSYYTILGVVPFLAICFALAQSFGLERALNTAITNSFSKFEGQEEILDQLRAMAFNLIQNYSGSLMVFVALAIIFWSGYRILTLMETVFGRIYGYHPPRRAIHRALDYFTVIIIVPLVLMAAGGITIYLNRLSTSDSLAFIPLGLNLGVFFSLLLIISPYIMWWLVLSWAYAYFSRGLMRWRERLVGGFISALAFQMFQTFYIRIMIALTSYNVIYGSFAAIPLFMIWLYTGWLIVLAGGEITRRFSDLFSTGRNFFSLIEPATWNGIVELSCRVMKEVIKVYTAEPSGGATSMRRLSRVTDSPLPSLGSAVTRLLNVGLLARVSGPTADDGPSFLPALCPDQLNDERIREILAEGLMEII
ncbi:MAG: YihY/virulence factor BrkB family protein [Candidatus Adiutrix sp.]|jgi:membrane protein|nr:YihY/virulence factor BrkB family protein [Candidatus Adiutrix sp.]